MAYEDKDNSADQVHEIDKSLDIGKILSIHGEGKNLADYIEDDDLVKIGNQVIEDYERDVGSRSGWDERNEEAIKMVMQVVEEKSFPWQGASNIKFPLVTVAAQQFAARVTPNLIPEPFPIKGIVYGYNTEEKQRAADRIGMHMSWQVTQQMRTWLDEQDILAHVLPVSGCCFKKTYRDSVKKQNVSELVLPNKLVFDYYAKDVEDARCKTELLDRHSQEIEENKRMGVYRKCDYGAATDGIDDEVNDLRNAVNETDTPEDTNNHRFLEQHTWYDLDGDGYEEPYTITVAEESRKVARIVPRFGEDSIEVVEYEGKAVIGRITADEYYTHYIFIPDPSGGNLGIGWGHMLKHINETVNTLLNQLIDAGTLENLGGGLISKDLKMISGEATRRPGEWKKVDTFGMDIRQGLYPWPTQPPSQVLYMALTLLIQWGQNVTSVTDPMMGETPPANTPASTTNAMIEQGQKVLQGSYKRIHRAQNREFQKLKRLNKLYMDPQEYYEVLDDQPELPPELQQAIANQQITPEQAQQLTAESGIALRTDYDRDDTDICPSAASQITSEQTSMSRLRLVMEAENGGQYINPRYKEDLWFNALGLPNSEKEQVFVEPPPPRPSPEFQLQIAELEHKIKHDFARLAIDADRVDNEEKRDKMNALIRAGETESKEMLKKIELSIKGDDVEGKQVMGLMQMQGEEGAEEEAADETAS